MQRRDFVGFVGAALGASLAAWPFALRAQQPAAIRRIGVLAPYAASENADWSAAFVAGLRALGYNEGRDYNMGYRYAQGDLKQLDKLAADLVALKPDVILAASTLSALAAQKHSRTIPIVTVSPVDPVAAGFARSLERPLGNVTGVTGHAPDLLVRRVELLRQVRPGTRRIALVYNPDSSVDALVAKEFQQNAKLLRIEAMYAYVKNAADAQGAFRELGRHKAQAVIVPAPVGDAALRASLVEEAERHGMLGMYGSRDFVQAGGLLSYAPDYAALFRRAASYADQILKGVRPGALSMERPKKFELYVNMKAARALRAKVPQALLSRADRVIE